MAALRAAWRRDRLLPARAAALPHRPLPRLCAAARVAAACSRLLQLSPPLAAVVSGAVAPRRPMMALWRLPTPATPLLAPWVPAVPAAPAVLVATCSLLPPAWLAPCWLLLLL